MAGRMIALRPDSVSSPVRHQPRSTVSPRPNEGSQLSVTAKR